MKKIFLTASALTFFFSIAAAQQPSGLNREMDVTREYEPVVERAEKINIKPAKVDTAEFRPELRYGISSTPISYGFDAAAINPASVNLDNIIRRKPFYLKAMTGFPLQSLVDGYATSAGSNGFIGAYLNHYGSWSKIENDTGAKSHASRTDNKAGINGEHRFGNGNRYSVAGGLEYRYDMITRYGYYDPIVIPTSFDTTASALRQNFSRLHADISVGNSFRDLSYFNFRVGLEGNYLKDRFGAAETAIDGFVDLGKSFGAHVLTLRAAYASHEGNEKIARNHKDRQISAIPTYSFDSESLSFALGADFSYETDGDENNFHFFPKASLELKLAGKSFVPYAEIDGGLVQNCYMHLVDLNPYIRSGMILPNTKEYHGRAGIKGEIASAVSYKLFGGFSRYEGLVMFANYFSILDYGNTFIGIWDGADMYTAGLDLNARFSRSVSARLNTQYFNYQMDNLPEAIGMPQLKSDLEIRYRQENIFSLYAGAVITGGRHFYDFDSTLATQDFSAVRFQKAVVDLKFGGEVKLLDNLNLVVDANNILNQRLYDFSRYAGLGVNLMAGIKVAF